MVIVLLKAKYSLQEEGEKITHEKNRLEAEMEMLGNKFYDTCHQARILSEVISPKTGYPIYSQGGELNFDLVATVHASLGYPFSNTRNNCKVLRHPNWQTAVYPGLFLSNASFIDTQFILRQLSSFAQDNILL